MFNRHESAVPDPRAGLFWGALTVTSLLKVILALAVPLTGDEAYFALWGMYPALGYYDHPPMIGWWLAGLLALGHSTFLVRLPAMVVPVAVAFLLRGILCPIDRERGNLVAALFLLTPFSAVGIITTTDTALVFFSALSALFAYRHYLRERWWEALLCGVFLGAAFLSKYFAVILGAAYASLYPAMWGSRRGLAPVVLIFLGALPCIALNVGWNYLNGWPNLMFNLFNRHGGAGFSLVNPLVFLGITAFWLGPGILLGLYRARKAFHSGFSEWWNVAAYNGTVVFVFLSLVPGLIFFLLSWVKSVGFHWLMSFFPLFFPVIFVVAESAAIRRMLRPTAWFSGVLAALALVFVSLPLEWLRSVRSHESIVLAARPAAVLGALAPWRGEYTLAAQSYAKAAMLGFVTQAHVPVFGPGSYNGRHDDFLTDFRAFEGGNVMIVDTMERRVARAAAWFRESERQTVEVLGGEFVVLLGRGFDYAAYRRDVLQAVTDEYYAIPPLLARHMRGSPFLDRYGFQPAERAR